MGKRINLSASFKNPQPAYSESDSDNESCSNFQPCCMTSPNPFSPISGISSDQMEALASNILNATSSMSMSKLSLVEENFAYLCNAFPESKKNVNPIKKNFQLSLEYGTLDFCIKAAEIQGKDNRLPIMESTHKDNIGLFSTLPDRLQQSLKVTTILSLLKQKFPKLTQSICEKEIPRHVFAVPVPLNQEKRGNFFPEIEVDDGLIAYIAWDTSGRKLAHGLKKKKCAILLKDMFENNTAFCGEMLSQENFEGIEKGTGLSAYFMTAKVTVIGIFIPEVMNKASGIKSWADELACDGFDLIERGGHSFKQRELACDNPSQSLRERGGGSSLSSTDTTFGMLGVHGAKVVTNQEINVPDRCLEAGEKPSLFCLEFVPKFHSNTNPVTKDDLEMAIDM